MGKIYLSDQKHRDQKSEAGPAKLTGIDQIKTAFSDYSKKPLKEKVTGIRDALGKMSLKIKLISLVVLVGIGLAIWQLVALTTKKGVTYETQKAEKGTLITSISGSGSITSGNYSTISTKVSGTVSKVYVTNGDKVTKGQKIAEVTLDEYAQERQTSAWVDYLTATQNVKQAIADKVSNDITMWKDRQAVLDAQTAYDDMIDNDTNPTTHATYTDSERMIITKTLDQKRKLFSVSESKYLDSNANIANANSQVAASLRDYQANSATIIAPVGGTISDLALAPNLLVSASSTTSNTSGATIVSAQTVGKITNPNGQLVATVTLTEIDITKVKANQKVILTLDAYSDKTFTGKVLSVNTSGSVSSGVTSYPVTILLDPVSVDIYPNMAVTAQIITNIKTDVILVPSTAITTNNQSTVEILKNGKPQTVTVETGDSNDSQTIITSGISEGDEIITAIINPTTITTNTTISSPFSGLGRTTNSTNRGSTTRSSGGAVFVGGGGPPGF